MRYCFIRFPDGKAKALTLSYDDGGANDKRLVETANKYGIKVTLNVNNGYFPEVSTDSRLSAKDLKELAASGGNEIAVHGEYHIALGKASAIIGIQDVLNCRDALEKEFGGIIRGMAYADSGIIKLTSGVTYEEIRIYLKALGIAYARTLGRDNNNFMLPEDFYAWMPTAHHTNPKTMEWIKEFVDFKMPAYCASHEARLFYLWGHSFEFRNEDDWSFLEELCKFAGGHDEIWYATNIEICEYVEAYRALRFSVDNTKVFNPTCTDIWFEADGKTYIAPAGKLTVLD